MKKFLFLSFLFAYTLYATAQDKDLFYAIDGSEWLTEGLRDDRENTLWEELHLNIRYLRVADKETDIQVDKESLAASLQELAVVVEEAIRYSRQQDQTLNELLTPEVRKYLEEKDIHFVTSAAANKERFIMKELCELYNIYLEGFDYLYKKIAFIADPLSEKFYFTVLGDGWLNTFVSEINTRTKNFKDKAYFIRETTIE
ncbi:hypothetical protein [Dysgonomonas sp. 25]|uniref:hypothetical protein n=1 Tax=Dysgonomonas sp. 25 TaxID=2302933 RepID=UPI0013D287A7|nr:hypothetical protein [Dysgonomonas sp. 25]NDV68155.1 hypothetical protein [Dysgonomonas sp. 25]